jgi:hypothetical protein
MVRSACRTILEPPKGTPRSSQIRRKKSLGNLLARKNVGRTGRSDGNGNQSETSGSTFYFIGGAALRESFGVGRVFTFFVRSFSVLNHVIILKKSEQKTSEDSWKNLTLVSSKNSRKFKSTKNFLFSVKL